MTTSVLILLATILTIEGDLVRIDKGYADGVRTGDTGRIYYTLVVGPERLAKRIDVGQIEILEVATSSADFRVPQTFRVHPGYSIEIAIPRDRFLPTTEILNLAQRHLQEGKYDQALSVLDTAEQMHRTIAEEPSVIDQISQLKAEIKRHRASSERTVRISGASYTIGVELTQASFHNQYPRFQVDVGTFQIDRKPISAADFKAAHPEQESATGSEQTSDTPEHGFITGITFDAATGYCRRLGMRLPTEFEWEIAARNPQFESNVPIHEWTSSWYLPYPGNNFPDEAYGESYRVLKGGTETAELKEVDYRLRRFLKPDADHVSVGFRCVLEQPERPTETQP